jgi:small subunit ribosomal protein S6
MNEFNRKTKGTRDLGIRDEKDREQDEVNRGIDRNRCELEPELKLGGKGIPMSRVYEVMFIVRPDAAEEDVDKLIAGFSTTVTGGGGVVKTVEKMGRRKLAYLVRKFNDGNYVLLTIEANGPVVLELERRLRVTEPVIKFITVRIDEEDKRLAKVKACAACAARSSTQLRLRNARPGAAPAPAAVAAPVEAAEPAPAAV